MGSIRRFIDGKFRLPTPRGDSSTEHLLVLFFRGCVWRIGLRVGGRLFAQPDLDVVQRLEERGAVVQSAKEIGMRVGASHGTSEDAARRSKSGEGRDAMDGKWGSAEQLSIKDDGECAEDASSNLKTV